MVEPSWGKEAKEDAEDEDDGTGGGGSGGRGGGFVDDEAPRSGTIRDVKETGGAAMVEGVEGLGDGDVDGGRGGGN